MTHAPRSPHEIKGVSFEIFEPIVLEATGSLRVYYLAGRSKSLVVSLAGVGKTRHGWPDREFVGSASCGGENHVLFVSDMSRSWMNGPGIADKLVGLIQRFMEFHGLTELVTLGNSMGGFAAIILADLMPVQTVIAFSPQFSAHRDQVPEEERWSYFRNRIQDWPFPHVGDMACADTKYFVVHSDAPDEIIHWQRFPRLAAINHFIVAGQDHNVVRIMQKRRILQGVVAAAMAGKTRAVRKQMQNSKFGRRFRVLRREDYELEFPDRSFEGQSGEHPEGKGHSHDQI